MYTALPAQWRNGIAQGYSLCGASFGGIWMEVWLIEGEANPPIAQRQYACIIALRRARAMLILMQSICFLLFVGARGDATRCMVCVLFV
jgi:hypothetical protein